MATEVIRSVGTGKTYTTLIAWEAAVGDCTSGDLVTNDEIAVAEITGDVFITHTYVDFNGFTCDATRLMLLRAATGQKFDYSDKSGAKLIQYGTDANPLVQRSGNLMEIHDLGISFGSATSVTIGYQEKVILRRCVVYNTEATLFAGGSYAENTLFIQDSGTDDFKARIQYITLDNCTMIQRLGYGAYSGNLVYYQGTGTNCVVFNENPYSTNINYQGCIVTTCAQNDNGSPDLPAGCVNGIVKADFTDYDNDDFSLPSTSELVDVGTDLSSKFTDDITGATRDSSFDIGAFEYIAESDAQYLFMGSLPVNDVRVGGNTCKIMLNDVQVWP